MPKESSPGEKHWPRSAGVQEVGALKATAERLEKNRVALQVEVEAERVDAALERAYRKLVSRVNIPGFRKGRAPRKIVEARLGKEALYDEALDDLIPAAYREALEVTQTEPIDQPRLYDVEIEEGKPLRFRAEVEVKPEAELGEYKGLEVEKLVEQVEEKDVDHILEHLREDHSELVPADRQEVQRGDFALIDFEGFIDGEPFSGGAGKGYLLEIGSGRFIDGFEEQLIGAKVGEVTEVKVTFPADYRAESLRGKEALFKVTVRELKVKRLPELDDEFAKDVGDAETLEELRAKIRKDLEQAAAERAEREMRDKLVRIVRDNSVVDAPEVLVEGELAEMVNEFARSLVYSGIDPQAYFSRPGRSIEDLKNELRPEAVGRVKARLVLETIAKREGIVVQPDELEARIEEIASGRRDVDAVRKELQDPDRRAALRESLLLEKVVDFLVAQAKVEERAVPSRGHGHVHHDHDHDHDHEHDELHDLDRDESAGQAQAAGAEEK